MVEKKEEPEKQAEPRQTSGQGSTTQAGVVELLASILNQVQQQVQNKTPKPLEGAALQAVEQFREIMAALALQPLPTITLKAEPTEFGVGGGTAKLSWTSTDAQTVSLDQNVGEVGPAAGGSIEVFVAATTTFTATAKGPCGSAAAKAPVTVAGLA
jgi:hypothetical protein